MGATRPSPDTQQEGPCLVYDGDCPICSMSAKAVKLKRTVGSLSLVNARKDTHHPVLQEIREQNLDLDEGMVLKYSNRLYHGVDALHLIALLSSKDGAFNGLLATLFKYRLSAAICYPVFRCGRNILLFIRGTPPISKDT